jgi:hypothetical protein
MLLVFGIRHGVLRVAALTWFLRFVRRQQFELLFTKVRREVVLEPLDFFEKRPDVFKTPVDRRKTHVSDLIEAAQRIHHHLTDLDRLDFSFAALSDTAFNMIDGIFNSLHRYRAFLERFEDARAKLVIAECFAAPVTFYDTGQAQFGCLISRKTCFATLAFTAPTDLIALTE